MNTILIQSVCRSKIFASKFHQSVLNTNSLLNTTNISFNIAWFKCYSNVLVKKRKCSLIKYEGRQIQIASNNFSKKNSSIKKQFKDLVNRSQKLTQKFLPGFNQYKDNIITGKLHEIFFLILCYSELIAYYCRIKDILIITNQDLNCPNYPT